MKRITWISIVVVFMLACKTITIGDQNNPTDLPDINEDQNNATPLSDTLEGFNDTVNPPETTIAFTSLNVIPPEIYTMTIEGKDIKRLTNTSNETVPGAYSPKWSPDKKQIAYSAGGWRGIPYLMNADGSNQRPLSNLLPTKCGDGDCPVYETAWAPDGLSIAAWSINNFYIVSMDDGEILHQIPVVDDEKFSLAAWLPNGNQIAIVAFDPTTVSIMNVNDNSMTRIADIGGIIGSVSVSPNGEKIAISSTCLGNDCADTLFVINSDGSGVIQLTDDTASNYLDVFGWTFDNNSILFLMRDNSLEKSSIMQISHDGTNSKTLLEKVYVSSNIVLSDDGKRILYVSELFGNSSIIVQNLDGTGELSLQGGYTPDW